MSVQVEALEKNLVKLTVEVPAEDVEKAMERVYQKNKGKMNIPGFRKGKAPRKLIEKTYGVGVFLEDAINDIVPEAYEEACKSVEKDIVSLPQIEYEQVDPTKALIFTATVAVKPEVTLGDYKGLEVEEMSTEVTEEEILAEIKKEQEKNAVTVTVEDRAVEDGDTVVLDFEGFVDGVPFEGGKGEGFPLVIGSHSFIDTFEEQLIGAAIGEEKEIQVTFPTEYHAEELAGKPAMFRCVVKGIQAKELPELDDEFASEVSDFETLEEYKADVRANLTAMKEGQAKTAKEDALVDKAVENAQMEIPDLMIDTESRNMVEEFEQRLQAQGLSMEQYMQFTGATVEGLVDECKVQAKKRIESRLVLEAIVAAEGITADDTDLEAEVSKMAEAYGMTVEETKQYVTEDLMERIKTNVAVQKAVDLLVEEAK